MVRAKFNLSERASGILLHPTSLPGGHGIGDLGSEARHFADFLNASGQRWWQMLPVTPAGSGNSPYHALSAFAGNPLLISLDMLAEEELLTSEDLSLRTRMREGRVDYPSVKREKEKYLRKAFSKFKKGLHQKESKPYEAFCEKAQFWLEDYALFSALKESHRNASWTEWEEPLRLRETGKLRSAKKRLCEEIDYHQFLQYEFFKQWSALKGYCNKHRIGLIGDLPIFVAHDSSDVWTHQDSFYLDQKGNPTVIVGVPPDYFSRTGQRWGNPLYRWDRLKEDGYRWWMERFRMTFQYFDAVRLDHFIGFYRYWEIPVNEPTALKGKWREGPREDFFEKLLGVLGPLELIAEDLGLVISEVKELRDRFNFPGLRVLQFAFDGDPKNDHLPENYPKRCIVYTGTHDNDTIVGWCNDPGSSASVRSKETIQKEKERVMRYLGTDGRNIHWDMIDLAMKSAADVAIFPLQDILGLETSARMNLPGTVKGNWEWRFRGTALTEELSRQLRGVTEAAGRIPVQK